MTLREYFEAIREFQRRCPRCVGTGMASYSIVCGPWHKSSEMSFKPCRECGGTGKKL